MQPNTPQQNTNYVQEPSATTAPPAAVVAVPLGQPYEALQLTKKPRHKLPYILVAVALVIVGVIVGVFLFKTSYPTYKSAQETTINGFTVGVFKDWQKETNDQSAQKTTTFSDYIDKNNKSSSLVHAQQVVVTQTNLVPKDQLTEAVKQEFIAQFTNKNTFFEGLGGKVEQCSDLQNKQVTSLTEQQLQNEYVGVDFSFSCPKQGSLPGIKAVGRLLVTKEGAMAVNFIAASEYVYSKNTLVLEQAAQTVRSK